MPRTKTTGYVLNARPDTLDFRDKMYVPNLYEVPVEIPLDDYRSWEVPILDQGREGACTGFGLATVVHYLLRTRQVIPDQMDVSPRMLYTMARRYDEWPGEDYSGSSARGAMKGWHKHGVCAETCWPYKAAARTDPGLNQERTSDALKRPLGAYYRVNHKDLVSMHTAMAEVGILYATAMVHDGWNSIDKAGVIPLKQRRLGGHAFAIVAYDRRGFWIQNSWGDDWGVDGFALITYDDWLQNSTDVWVARLGAPVILQQVTSAGIAHSAAAAKSNAYSYADLRPHIISIGNDGLLKPGGSFGSTEDEVQSIFTKDFVRVTENWGTKRLLLYAHGGLVSEDAAVQRLADLRPALLEAEVYPVSFIWHSDAWSTITNIVQDALRRRKPEGILDAARDFMLDRLDDALEPLARTLTGRMQWTEMKENAMMATSNKKGGARLALGYIQKLVADIKNVEIHLVGHSAGSIFHALLVQLLTTKGKINSGPLKGTTGLGLTIASCTLWAPAITINLFKQTYLPAIQAKTIDRFAVFNLTDQAEQDDHCAHIYHKSLLYLVSNAFEDKARIPLFRPEGTPLLGMEKFIADDKELKAMFKKANCQLVLSPNNQRDGSPHHSTARAHGDFDDDKPTVKATLARILNKGSETGNFVFSRSQSSLSNTRRQLQNNSGANVIV